MKKNYYLIDVFKYIFCLGIVVLHTNVQDSFGDYRYWIQKLLLRLGVPFFFMVSGFMLEGKLSKTGYTLDDMKAVFLGWTKRLVIPLVVFESISIVLDSIYFYQEGESVLLIVTRAVRGIVFYPGGATWYLQACIVGVWIIYLFVKARREKWIIPCGTCLYAFALICNSYNFVIADTQWGNWIDLFLKLTRSARNGLFYGFLFLALGMLAYRVSVKIQQRNVRVYRMWHITGLMYIFYFLEIYLLRNVEMKDDGSLFIILPLFTFSLLVTISQYSTESVVPIRFRNLSTGIYLLHRPIINVIKIFTLIFGWTYSVYSPLIITVVVAHVICLLAYKKDNRISDLLR